jgi:S-formylglutathione hydrolase
VPALYFLAGLTCTEETFVDQGRGAAGGRELGLALVTCDTSPRIGALPR